MGSGKRGYGKELSKDSEKRYEISTSDRAGVRRYNRSVIVGKSNDFKDLKASQRLRVFYTGRWSREVSFEAIKDFLRKFEAEDIEELKTVHSKFKSYRFKCDASLSKSVQNPENWPCGITVRLFYESRKNKVEASKEFQNLEGLPTGGNNGTVEMELSGENASLPVNSNPNEQ